MKLKMNNWFHPDMSLTLALDWIKVELPGSIILEMLCDASRLYANRFVHIDCHSKVYTRYHINLQACEVILSVSSVLQH